MKKKELSQDQILPLIEPRITILKEILNQTKEILPADIKQSIKIIKKRKHFEYYIIQKKGDTNGKYLQKNNIELAKKIIQNDYNKKLIKELKTEIKALESLQKHYAPQNIPNLYKKLPIGRKLLLTPVQLPASEFAARWKSLPNPGNPYAPENKIYETTAGLYVRSKSEVLIANALTTCNIPFHYEKPLQFKSGKTIFPDFTCLNTITRREILWEHFGLMDDPVYAENAVSKIHLLIKEGYFPGKNFIATFESKNCPLTPQIISQITKDFLL